MRNHTSVFHYIERRIIIIHERVRRELNILDSLLLSRISFWSWHRDLNSEPQNYKFRALPIELCQHLVTSMGIEPMLQP